MRVTQKRLEGMVEELNKAMGLPTAWTKTANGPQSNPGSLVLDTAYGGYRLAMISTYGGGEKDISGFCTARELYNFILGLDRYRHLQQEVAAAKAHAEGEEERDARRRAAQEALINKPRLRR